MIDSIANVLRDLNHLFINDAIEYGCQLSRYKVAYAFYIPKLTKVPLK